MGEARPLTFQGFMYSLDRRDLWVFAVNGEFLIAGPLEAITDQDEVLTQFWLREIEAMTAIDIQEARNA